MVSINVVFRYMRGKGGREEGIIEERKEERKKEGRFENIKTNGKIVTPWKPTEGIRER